SRRAPRDADPPDAGGRARPRELRAGGLRPRAAAGPHRAHRGRGVGRADLRRRRSTRGVRGGPDAHGRRLAVPLSQRRRAADAGRRRQRLRRARHRDRRAPRGGAGARRGHRVRGGPRRARRGAAALSATDGASALGDVLQHRHHRWHGQPARRVRGRPARLGGGIAGRGVPQSIDERAPELLAPRPDPARAAGGHLRQARRLRYVPALGIVVLAALPAVLSSYLVTVFTFIFFYAYLGQAWNIVGGYAGQLSAGHAAFVGVGAYTAAL